MTPAARVAAAITILDDILSGSRAEQALTAWGRRSRFAGSKDRAGIRDLVFDALRKRASCAAFGGGLQGRALMLGMARQEQWAVEEIFSGTGHAPAALTAEERGLLEVATPLSETDAMDLPAWIWAQFEADLGTDAAAAAQTLRTRAGVFLRINQRKATIGLVQGALSRDGIETEAHPVQPGCLRVMTNPRRIQRSEAYADGWFEVQDPASQIAVAGLNIPAGAAVLDYCAGGGGKALAIADRFDCQVTAHDAAARRMADISPRAERAGVSIDIVAPDDLYPERRFDVVIVDAPCSGSGTWRRNPEDKWQLTPEKLNAFSALQGEVLAAAAGFLKPGGQLVYMTCSVFADENIKVVTRFLSNRSDVVAEEPPLHLRPTDQWDGFFCQTLRFGKTTC